MTRSASRRGGRPGHDRHQVNAWVDAFALVASDSALPAGADVLGMLFPSSIFSDAHRTDRSLFR